MSNSRRQFLNRASVALMASAAACRRASQTPTAPLAGAPPAFGTAPPVGPAVSPATFAEGEKLVQFPLSPAARQMAAGNWSRQMAPGQRPPPSNADTARTQTSILRARLKNRTAGAVP